MSNVLNAKMGIWCFKHFQVMLYIPYAQIHVQKEPIKTTKNVCPVQIIVMNAPKNNAWNVPKVIWKWDVQITHLIQSKPFLTKYVSRIPRNLIQTQPFSSNVHSVPILILIFSLVMYVPMVVLNVIHPLIAPYHAQAFAQIVFRLLIIAWNAIKISSLMKTTNLV